MEAQGEYHYDPAAPRPHRFRLVVPKADAVRVEKLLMPTLHRGNFINYAFNFGRVPEPDWLRVMKADGTIQIGLLALGGQDFTDLRARVLWDSDGIQLSALSGGLGPAAFAGSATIRLAERQPLYAIQGKLTDFPWHSGVMSADISLATSGTGPALFENLRAGGSFQGRAIDLSPLDLYDSVAGVFEWAGDARRPRLRLTQLVLKNGLETYQGTGDMDDNGRVVLKLSDGARQAQTSGAILSSESFKP